MAPSRCRSRRASASSSTAARSSATGSAEPPMAARPLYTLGYEKARLDDVIAALKDAGVATLIDVRDRPISRRPGFSKRQLAAGVGGSRHRLCRVAGARHPDIADAG